MPLDYEVHRNLYYLQRIRRICGLIVESKLQVLGSTAIASVSKQLVLGESGH
jgi:hypothetical protein